jgi:hypothetical protein
MNIYIISYERPGGLHYTESDKIEARDYAEAAHLFLLSHTDITADKILRICECDYGDDEKDYARVEVWHVAGILYYVNGWTVTRHCGGPEEGGWYFNAGEPVASIPVKVKCPPTVTPHEFLSDKLTELKAILEDRFKDGNIYSVLGGTDVSVAVDTEFAQPWPEEKPHYE